MPMMLSRRDFNFHLLFAVQTAFAAVPARLLPAPSKRHCLVYIGTYTGGQSEGIYLCEFDTTTGRIEILKAFQSENPAFLAIDSRRRFLYAANEVSNWQGQRTGAVSAFAIDPQSGDLRFLNQQASAGAGPCHVTTDRKDRCVLVANYGGGSVAVLPIAKDGRLEPASDTFQFQGSGPNPARQQQPHAHSVTLDPANRYVFVADLGTDKLMISGFDSQNGKLVPHEPPFVALNPGAGPRHVAFHPSGNFLYVINELECTVASFSYEPQSGILSPLQTIATLPTDFTNANTCADIHITPDGKLLYGSNRGHDSVAIFCVDSETGKLTASGHAFTGGKKPRNFAIDPTGQYLLAANQDSDTIVVFRINPQTGQLTAQSQVRVPSPVCVKMILGR